MKAPVIISILAILFLLEIGFLAVFREPVFLGGNYWNPLLLLFSGVGIGFLAILARKKEIFPPNQSSILNNLLLFGLTIAGFAFALPEILAIYKQYPILPKYADILPQIDKMIDLFLAGENPYEAIKVHHDYEIVSPYMPFHWGPLILPKVLGVDLRLGTLGLWLLAILFFTWQISRSNTSIVAKVLLVLLPAIFLNLLAHYQPIIFRISAELSIAACYLFLASTLLRKSTIWVGIALLTCLLSRYMVVFWVPLLGLIWWKEYQKKETIILGGIVLGGILLFYILPFFTQNPAHISQGLAHHDRVMEKVWTFEPWHAETIDKPATLFKGLGMAGYFYDFWPGEILHRLKAAKTLHLVIPIITILGLGIYYLRKGKSLHIPLFLLGSLKIYLTLFYHLLPLPIEYYFFVPLCVSMVLLVAYWNYYYE